MAPAPVKFYDHMERFQRIHNLQKAPVGSQMKRVIDLLFQTRRAYTQEEILESCHVDLNANRDVFDGLKNNNLKVEYDGKHFSYRSKYDLKDKTELLGVIRKFPEGIAVSDLKDAYGNVMEDLLALRASGLIRLLSNEDIIAYPNDSRVPVVAGDDDLKRLFWEVEVSDLDMLDIEKYLQKYGMKPATKTANRRQVQGFSTSTGNPKKKKRETRISKRTKLTNTHVPELFRDDLQ